MCMHKGELANINPPRITTEPSKILIFYSGRLQISRNISNVVRYVDYYQFYYIEKNQQDI